MINYKLQVSKIRPSFTLIEMLVAIAIFSIFIAVASSTLAINYIVGRTQATAQAKVNHDISRVTDLIYQKTVNANIITTFNGQNINGYGVIRSDGTILSPGNGSSNLLVLVSWGPAGNVCTYIGLDSNGVVDPSHGIVMMSENCGTLQTSINNTFVPLNSHDVKVTAFTVAPVSSKVFELTLTETDPNGKNSITINNGYKLGY